MGWLWHQLDHMQIICTSPVPHHSVFTGRMPFLPPSQQCQSTEGTRVCYSIVHNFFYTHLIPLLLRRCMPKYFTLVTNGIWLSLSVIGQWLGLWPPKVISWLFKELNLILSSFPYSLQYVLISVTHRMMQTVMLSSAYEVQPTNTWPSWWWIPYPECFDWTIKLNHQCTEPIGNFR